MLVDFTQMFVYRFHEIVFYGLKYSGCFYNSSQLLKSYLFERKQNVILEEFTSLFVSYCYGVPYGCMLGLELFLIYMNTITTCNPNTYFILAFLKMLVFYINIEKNVESSRNENNISELVEKNW